MSGLWLYPYQTRAKPRALRRFAAMLSALNQVKIPAIARLGRTVDDSVSETSNERAVGRLSLEGDRVGCRPRCRNSSRTRAGRAPARRSTDPGHGRKAHRQLGLLARILQELGPGQRGDRLVADCAVGLQDAERRSAAGVNDPLWDALAVEVADLLAGWEATSVRRYSSIQVNFTTGQNLRGKLESPSHARALNGRFQSALTVIDGVRSAFVS